MGALDPRLVHRARPVRVLLAVDVGIGLAAALLVLVGAALLARIVVRAVDGASLAGVGGSLAALALVFAARGARAWAFEVAGRRAAASTLSELRLALVAQRLREQPAALDRAEAGELTAAAVQGIDGLEAYFARYLPQLVLGCVVPVAVLAWVAAIDLESALVMALTLPLVPVFMSLVGRASEARARERWQALRLLSAHFLDVVRGLPTLRAFNRGEAQTAAIADVAERYRRATMGTLRVSFLSGSVLELAATLGVALVAVTVGVRLAQGGVGFEAALTVLVLAPELYLPLRRVGAQFHASADGVAVARRILDLLDATPAVSHGARRAPTPVSAPVRLEGVSFAYAARPGLVLAGVDLELAPRETVALVGPSGAGKSTLAALLLRLAEPTAGRITVGGVDLACCDAAAWRRHVAWVPQRPTILRGTVAENIRLGDADADDARVVAAAVLAGADRFVRALPSGYDTLVGDGGRPLSAGERRRIALARAFLRDAPFVVLDEPTADLDPAGAGLVAEAVARLATGRTTLLITHRPELVARADRVVTLARGAVVDGSVREAA
ncbi:MAG: thiol reductant ABC exporter subunit CydD [Gaiellaceae bacterium]